MSTIIAYMCTIVGKFMYSPCHRKRMNLTNLISDLILRHVYHIIALPLT